MFPIRDSEPSGLRAVTCWRVVPIPAWVFIGLWFALQLLSWFAGEGGVAWGAHVGGFLCGVAWALLAGGRAERH